MKKLLLTACLFGAFVFSGYAQTDTTAKKELTKEEKAALKAKQEADLNEAYKEAGLTDAQIASCKEAIAEASKKSSELKKNAALSEDDKTAAKKIINDEKNNKLKTIMGEEAYKKYNAVRKRQKENSKAQQ